MLHRPSIFSARHLATGSKPSRQARICFVWTHNGPAEVEIVDYH